MTHSIAPIASTDAASITRGERLGSDQRHARFQRGMRDHLMLHFSRHSALQTGEDVLVLESAEGVHVVDIRGRRYLDALSCLFCA